ncbi:enhanced serine sensitivity protein SseB C-terminal domain-containing protein [Brevundimonas sp.]|uniref:enhanced serine sensitivity protein SseB C-terminal domain-containing protein n=1 Tax=Brevundimonas sp. TaxID=1871086 RepID=UPI003AF64904
MTDSAPPAFSPLNDLEMLLMAASSGGADERAAFEAAVPASKLWAVVAEEDAATDTLRLRTVTPKDGRPATAIFTARERALAVFGADAAAEAFDGRALLEVIRVNPAVLNPGQPYGVSWPPAALSAMVGQSLPAEDARWPTHLAKPKETPEGLVEGLTRAFAADPSIKAAWLALARWSDGSDTGFYLDVRMPQGEAHLPAVMDRALAGVTLDARLDVGVRAPEAPAGIGLEIVAPRD